MTLIGGLRRRGKMKNKFIAELLKVLNNEKLTFEALEQAVKNECVPKEERVISISCLINMINEVDEHIKLEEKLSTPKTKFLYVEDGSVDVDELENTLCKHSPEIQIIVYRQGSHPPIFINKEENL